MACLFALLAAFFPRLTLLFLWVFTPYVNRAFDTFIWPLLGVIFLPFATLMYVLVWNTGGRGVDSWEWGLVALAAFLDISNLISSAYANRTRVPTYPSGS